MRGKRLLSFGLPVILAVALGVLVVSCGGGGKETAAAPPPAKRTIYMSAVEYKGSTEVAKEPFPATQVDNKGYILKAPAEGKWETSTYRFEPGAIVVYQGDDVELKIWGVNGAEHPAVIEGYVPNFNVKRGQLTTVSFKADKAGVFRITCAIHAPSMESTLVVLPR